MRRAEGDAGYRCEKATSLRRCKYACVLKRSVMLSAALVLSVLATVGPGWTADDYARLFRDAVRSDGGQYVAIRSEFLRQGQKVTEFLGEKSRSGDLRERVVARALTNWVAEPERNQARARRLVARLGDASRSIVGPLKSVRLAAMGDPGPLGAGLVEPADELNEPAAIPYLLETAVKDGVEGVDSLRFTAGAPQMWARCYAATAVGKYDDDDVFALLADMLQGEKQHELRVCAATGLGRARNVRIVEPLIGALSDPDAAVRSQSMAILKSITGQDFGEDGKKYEEWLAVNRDKLFRGRK